MINILQKNYNEIIKQIDDSINIKNLIKKDYLEKINNTAEIIIDAYNNQKKVLWMGNGGSAADAQHLACELVSKFNMERKALSSIALTTNTSLLTAISNDYDFTNIFTRQIEGLANKGDILIGITTSGKSKNIINAMKFGKKIGTINIAFTGEYAKDLDEYSDITIAIPSNKTPRIQELHIMIGHIICDLIEKSLFSK